VLTSQLLHRISFVGARRSGIKILRTVEAFPTVSQPFLDDPNGAISSIRLDPDPRSSSTLEMDETTIRQAGDDLCFWSATMKKKYTAQARTLLSA